MGGLEALKGLGSRTGRTRAPTLPFPSSLPVPCALPHHPPPPLSYLVHLTSFMVSGLSCWPPELTQVDEVQMRFAVQVSDHVRWA